MYEFQYKLTKYDPRRYGRPEWTSISDIGKSIDGHVLTLAEYEQVENLYLDAIKLAADHTGVSHLAVRGLETYGNQESSPRENQLISVPEAVALCRGMLREGAPWCRLEADNRLFIHIGHDLYMYIGANTDIAPLWTSLAYQGLFIEENWVSPYLPDDNPINGGQD